MIGSAGVRRAPGEQTLPRHITKLQIGLFMPGCCCVPVSLLVSAVAQAAVEGYVVELLIFCPLASPDEVRLGASVHPRSSLMRPAQIPTLVLKLPSYIY